MSPKRKDFAMHVQTALALALALFLAAPAVRADEKERTARTACLSGDYTRGLALLSELFVDTKNPTHIYNQGRCLEQNRRYDDAIGRFQEYLRVGIHLSDEEWRDANKHIADCQALLDHKVEDKKVEDKKVESAATHAELPAGPPLRQTNGWKSAGIVVAALGGGALLGGLLLNLKVNSMASDMEKYDGYTKDTESSRKTYETLGWVGYGLGAACVVAGAALYGLHSNEPEARPSTVSLAPVIGSGRAGVSLRGAF